jgi:HlyD family secretion protein
MRRRIVFSMPMLLAACGGNGANVFPGTVEIEQVRVSARVGGYVESVRVSRGDSVIGGQLLVKLDQVPCSLSLAGAEAGLAGAEAALQTVLQGTRQQQLASAAAAVEEAGALMTQRQTDLARARELASAGALSGQDLQAAETAAVQASSRFDTAVQAYSLAAEGARTSEIQSAEALVDASRAAVDMALEQLEWTSVFSPVSGVVTGISVQAGENVSAGLTLLTVASMDTVKVVFYVPEPLLGKIALGDSVTVTSDGGDSSAGVVSFIAQESEFTPSTVETRDGRTSLVYRMEAELRNPGGVFKGGMPVDVVVETI